MTLLRSAFRNSLKQGLHYFSPESQWSKARPMSHVADRLARNPGKLGEVSPAATAEAVRNFLTGQTPDTWRGMRLLCHSMGFRVPQSGCIFEAPADCQRLLALVHTGSPRLQRQMYRGLIASYLALSSKERNSLSGTSGFEVVRDFLRDQAGQLEGDQEWVTVLKANCTLFDPRPGTKYAAALLRGDRTEIDHLTEQLGIPATSWFHEEVLLTHVESVCRLTDQHFTDELERLLGLLWPQCGGAARPVDIESTALLLVRYWRMAATPEHPVLRDAAVELFGDPWAKQQNWLAMIRLEDGSPAVGVHSMVLRWVKRRLIREFFHTLSGDGALDSRRVQYWLGHEEQIDEIWFALGRHARTSTSESLRAFRRSAKEHTLILEDSNPAPEYNVFIMRIGELIVVEFGQHGNACFFYEKSNLDFRLRGIVTVAQLKSRESRRFIERLNHSGGWEHRFDWVLRHHIRRLAGKLLW